MDEILKKYLAENQPPELTLLSQKDIIRQSAYWPTNADFEDYEKRMLKTFV